MKKTTLIALTGAALAVSAACTSSGRSSSPDEFRVVTKAPLTVPPDYKLRPPQAGSMLPAEVDPSRTEVASAFGTTIGQDASASERALVAAAGANATNPIIRAQVDYDETKTLRKRSSVVDTILFWREDDEEVGFPVEDNATGGEEVTIERGNSSPRLKLPGT